MSTPSLLNIPYLYKAGTLYSQIPESGAGDFTVTRTTTPTANRSTRVNKDGLIELVNDNVPRLDYPLGGAVNGCPALLVEPSAQNITTNSEVISGSPTGASIDANVAVSPDGSTTADKLKEGSSLGLHSLGGVVGGSLGGTVDSSPYRISIFAKADGRNQFTFFDNNQTGAGAGSSTFNLSNGTATGTGVIQNYGNGWYRCIISCAKIAATSANALIRLLDAGGNQSYQGNGTSGILFWGKQLETGSVATSYIPTTTAAVTRSADIIRKTNIASLIGQSEGTVYFEVEVTAEARDKWICTLDSGNSDYIQLGVNPSQRIFVTTIRNNVVVGSTMLSSVLTLGYHKVAYAYNTATNGCQMFVDGVQNPVLSRTISVMPFMDNVRAGGFTTNSTDSLKAHIRAAAIYPTRLPNTAGAGVLSLATLTA